MQVWFIIGFFSLFIFYFSREGLSFILHVIVSSRWLQSIWQVCATNSAEWTLSIISWLCLDHDTRLWCPVSSTFICPTSPSLLSTPAPLLSVSCALSPICLISTRPRKPSPHSLSNSRPQVRKTTFPVSKILPVHLLSGSSSTTISNAQLSKGLSKFCFSWSSLYDKPSSPC